MVAYKLKELKMSFDFPFGRQESRSNTYSSFVGDRGSCSLQGANGSWTARVDDPR